MRLFWHQYPNQPSGRSSTVRPLVMLFVSLLVVTTAFLWSSRSVLAATPWTVNPGSMTAGDSTCPQSADGSWTCSVSLADPATGSKSAWSATFVAGKGGHPGGVTFTPSKGILSPGETTPITIHIARTASACQNGFFRFSSGKALLAQATWNCTFARVVMTVSPTTLNPSNDPNCTPQGTVVNCTVTLANPAYSTDGFQWKVSFTSGIQQVMPATGTLTPNESTPVTIVVSNFACGGDTVTFTARSLRTKTNPPPVTVTVNSPTCP